MDDDPAERQGDRLPALQPRQSPRGGQPAGPGEQVRTDKGGRTVRTETMIFPRYHQLDVVRKLVDHAKAHGAGRNDLIQHSAGSGKSNSIAWLAHRLASLHDMHDEKGFTPSSW